MFLQAIHSARERIWTANPYFVPDEGVMASLHLAALRRVDVKTIIPNAPDSKRVYLGDDSKGGQQGAKKVPAWPGYTRDCFSASEGTVSCSCSTSFSIELSDGYLFFN